MYKLATLVLLAGFSRRMGSPKQHVKIFGKTFLQHITDALTNNSVYFNKMLFVGQINDEISQEYVKNINKGLWINNPNPELGPLSSIRLALKELDSDYSVLLWPVDHPLIKSSTVSHIINSWKKKPDYITIPSNGTRRGHPTIFPNWACRQLFDIDLSQGAKQVILNNPNRINYLLTDDPFIITNLNTPESLEKISINRSI